MSKTLNSLTCTDPHERKQKFHKTIYCFKIGIKEDFNAELLWNTLNCTYTTINKDSTLSDRKENTLIHLFPLTEDAREEDLQQEACSSK